MPVVKTEITPKTRANVAYAAAMTGCSETEIYGLLLDTFAGLKGPDELVKVIEKVRENGASKNASDSNDSQ